MRRPSMSRSPLSNGPHARAALLASLASIGALAALVAPGCSETPDPQAVRSLEGSGDIAYLCMAKPGSATIFLPLAACTHTTADTIRDFGLAGDAPHLYALVTQATRGEVAMVDLSTETGDVLDQDPSTPGSNFLPVGVNPTAIVSSPRGTASFVTSGDLARPMLYALPSTGLRPCTVDDEQCAKPAPTLSSWPACQLPSSPGQMKMIADPEVGGSVRKTCTSPFAAPDPAVLPVGNIDLEGRGRQKLVVALPAEHKLVVIDAQSVLESAPGSISDCVIEKEIPLDEVVLPVEPPPAPTPGAACVSPKAPTPGAIGTAASRPSGMAFQDGRLYVGDYARPLIHVVEMSSPCDAAVVDPFVATSTTDPARVVITSDVAVTPILPSFKRFLYAIDVEDRSVMVFDASDVPSQRTPLANPNPEWNPIQPPDRVRFGASPTSLRVVQRDAPKSDPVTGTAPFGVRCDPDPNLTTCSGNAPCDLGTAYRTSSDFTTGAGPLTLRGTFAMISLSSGQIATLDVDDYDAACRGPSNQSVLSGCGASALEGLVTSTEGSCNAVVPNEPRSGSFIASNTDTGRHLPGIQGFPILQNKEGDVITPGENGPIMRATLPGTGAIPTISVSGEPTALTAEGLAEDPDGARAAVLMNLEDPRVHVADQDWTVTFEGALPGFAGHVGDLRLAAGDRTLVDESSAFCSAGVQSEASVRAILEAEGVTGGALATQATAYADRLQITNDLIAQENAFWESASCSFLECRNAFGDGATPTLGRDILIREAFDDHLELGEPPAGPELTKCCFPSTINFAIRPGSQWTVVGAISGFFHHVIENPADSSVGPAGACRNSCDGAVARMNGRVRSTTAPIVLDTDAAAFTNPMLRFAITSTVGGEPRDLQFRFTTEGAFSPLRVPLTDDRVRPDVLVRALDYVPSIDAFVMSDGALEGLLIVAGDLIGDTKQIY